MSTLTFNPFDLLDDNGGDRPRRQTPKAPAVAKPAKPVDAAKAQPQASQPKTAATKAGAAATNAPATGKKDVDTKARPQGDAQRSKVPAKDGAGKRSPPGQTRPQQAQGVSVRVPGDDNAVEKPRERRDRDHRTHDRPDRRGRQFDRRSGTGRPANENKRAGGGKANWGKIGEGEEAEVTPKDNAEGEKEDAAAPAEGGEAVAAEPPKEPEKELLSLDEYLATKKNKVVSGVEAPKIRQLDANDGAWADYAPITRDGEDSLPSKKKKDVRKEAPTNGKDGKVSVDQFFRVTMPPHEGAENRGRGRGKGQFNSTRGNRGGARQGQKPVGRGQRQGEDAALGLEDQTKFPTLGGATAPSPAQPAPVKA